jgi:hypothetical protein
MRENAVYDVGNDLSAYFDRDRNLVVLVKNVFKRDKPQQVVAELDPKETRKLYLWLENFI